MRALITGITGFAGSHLAELLLEKNAEVFGTTRRQSKTGNIDHLKGRVRLVECDLQDAAAVSQTITQIQPDRLFHLAGQSFMPATWKNPSETLLSSTTGQINLLEAIRLARLDTRVQIAGSAEEYGPVREEELPLTEDSPLRPVSPYAVAKVTQDLMGYQYAHSYPMFIVRTRAFNHTGPRCGEAFATSSFAKQIALIEAGQQEPVLQVGNLDARRDFTDVRDIVRGYWLALEQGEPGEAYNLCSGKSVPVRKVLDILLSKAFRRIEIRVDPERLRPSDVPALFGDSSKFRKKTGWQAAIPLEQTLEDLLNDWRKRVKLAAASVA